MITLPTFGDVGTRHHWDAKKEKKLKSFIRQTTEDCIKLLTHWHRSNWYAFPGFYSSLLRLMFVLKVPSFNFLFSRWNAYLVGLKSAPAGPHDEVIAGKRSLTVSDRACVILRLCLYSLIPASRIKAPNAVNTMLFLIRMMGEKLRKSTYFDHCVENKTALRDFFLFYVLHIMMSLCRRS